MMTFTPNHPASLTAVREEPVRPRILVISANGARGAELAEMLRLEFDVDVANGLAHATSPTRESKFACVILSHELTEGRAIDLLPRFGRDTAVVVVGVPNEDAALALMRRGAEDALHDEDLVCRGIAPVVRRVLARRVAYGELCDAHHQRELLERQLAQTQKMEALGRLAGGVAHDFNNVLTAILSFARFVVDQLAPGDPRRDDLVEVLKAADRARGLTRQLLTYSRKQPVEGRVTRINDVVESVTELLRRTVGEHIRLDLRLATDLESVFMDPGQLEQIILNMVINARDAMPNGGTITLRTENTVHDFGEGARDAVVLHVRDTGLGMTEAVAARIFEPFFTTKGRERGTGLGLSTCYGIVKRAHGDIVVDTTPGRGTTFSVVFPRVKKQTAAMETLASEVPVARGAELVLVVEDDDAVRTLTARILRKHGYKTLEAPNPAVARALFAEHREAVALLISDVVMADTHGPELARQLLRERPTLPVLFMTGYDDETLTVDVLRSLPRSRVLVKPFLEVSLLQKARELLDNDAPTVAREHAQGRTQVLIIDDSGERADELGRRLQTICDITHRTVSSDPIAVFQALAETSFDALVCGNMTGGFGVTDLLEFVALHYPRLFARTYVVAGKGDGAETVAHGGTHRIDALAERLATDLGSQRGAA